MPFRKTAGPYPVPSSLIGPLIADAGEVRLEDDAMRYRHAGPSTGTKTSRANASPSRNFAASSILSRTVRALQEDMLSGWLPQMGALRIAASAIGPLQDEWARQRLRPPGSVVTSSDIHGFALIQALLRS